MRNVGDVIAIYLYDDKDHTTPSGIGVVLKVYKDDRCFVKLLRNYRIPRCHCQNWRRFGIQDKSGYYVRLEDRSCILGSTLKTTYTVSSVPAYASKVVTRSNGGLESRSGYIKRYSKTITEVYLFDKFDEIIPKFVVVRDLSDDRDEASWSAVVTQKTSNETFNEMARRAYARLQTLKYERLSV